MRILSISEFGDTTLRKKARNLLKEEIVEDKIRQLIEDMHYTLIQKKLGVGLAAPQVGKSLQLAVIKVQPTKHRPEVEPFDAVIINPVITDHSRNRKQLWEGCISGCAGKAGLFAKVPRYPKIKLSYYDEMAKQHHKWFNGLPAQVIQHEVDHLNGMLFVDRVKDSATYTTYNEYLKLVKRENH